MATELQKQIYEAVNKNDHSRTRDLLIANPSSVNERAAGLSWLSHAASSDQCDVEMVKLLIDLGADVNPTGIIWTPLDYAMPNATLDVIRVLLDHGAHPNGDRCIIGALNRKEEKLIALKLLIEYGADVNQVYDLEGTSAKFTALDWTNDPEIVAYLRSVGAKTSDEILQADINKQQTATSALSETIQFFGETFGKVDEKSLIEIVPGRHPVAIHVIRPSGKQDPLTLFTTGLSSAKMNVPNGLEEYALAELFIQLPGDWDFASSDPHWAWPIEWLRRIAKHPHEDNVCLGGPITIIANKEPPEPIGPNIDFTSLMLLAEKSFKRSDDEIVKLFRLIPIYSDERELEIKEGMPALMRAFDQNSVPFVVDLQRQSVATGS